MNEGEYGPFEVWDEAGPALTEEQQAYVNLWAEKQRIKAERDSLREQVERYRAALEAAWPGLSGRSYDRPISEVHEMARAALAREEEPDGD